METITTKKRLQGGQALVLLLVFVVLAIVYTTAAIIIMAVNSSTAAKVEQGVIAQRLAESGAENTLMNLIRNPDYGDGSYSFEDGDVQVTIVGGDQKTITSQATIGPATSEVEVLVDMTDNVLRVLSWNNIY